MVATGKLLDTTDVINGQMQTFYTIIDGTASSFNTVTTPITRSDLTPVLQTQLTSINTLSSTSKGWYDDRGSTLSPASDGGC